MSGFMPKYGFMPLHIYISPFTKLLHHLKTKTQTDRAGPSPSWNSPAEPWRRSENPMGPWQLFGHLQWEISMGSPKRKWMINEDSKYIYIFNISHFKDL